MNAKILAFPGGDVPPISDEEFRSSLRQPAILSQVAQAAMELAGLRDAPDIAMPPIFMLRGQLEGGTVHKITKNKREFAVGTSGDYPRWLYAAGFTHDEALQIASLYVDSFALVTRWIVDKPHTVLPGFASNINRPIWLPDYANERLAIPYRAAGRLVLSATRRKEALTLPPRPFPPHIAGLANPLDKYQFREMSAQVLK